MFPFLVIRWKLKRRLISRLESYALHDADIILNLIHVPSRILPNIF